MKVEVFKTDVRAVEHARKIVREIQIRFSGCSANFDLDDCDHVLRVVSPSDPVAANAVVTLMKEFGFRAEVLSDDIPELLQF